MKVINFAHPLTETQIEEILNLTDADEVLVYNVPTQINTTANLSDQIRELVDAVGFTSYEWQSESFIVNVPGLANAAVMVIAEIHGRSGIFPPVLKIAGKPGDFHVYEVLDLQEQRSEARQKR